jgi:hypothetical protein
LDPSGLLAEAVSRIYPPEDSKGHDQYVDADRWHQSGFPSISGNRVGEEVIEGPKAYDSNAVYHLGAALFRISTHPLDNSCDVNTRLKHYSLRDKVLMCIKVEDDDNIKFWICPNSSVGLPKAVLPERGNRLPLLRRLFLVVE